MKQFFTILLTLTLFQLPVFGQVKVETVTKIDNYLLELEKVGFSGSVLIGVNGSALVSKGFGFCNIERQYRNSPSTIFCIGSVTKQFTATAILKLEMQGKLSTADKLSSFFDKLPKDKASITIHDLLRHQSGLASNVGKDYEKIRADSFLNKVFLSVLKFEPGTGFSYSNIGYSLLAMIIEKVSGQTYETYLYENLWKPAQMEMTGYSRPKFDTNLIAVGYGENNVWGKPTEKEWDGSAPYWHLKGNGGILSTTEDLYKWHSCLMSTMVLSKEAKHKLYHPNLRTGETDKGYYAYGWDVSKTSRNSMQVWHNGTNRIFYADFLRYIDEDVTLITLSNKAQQHLNDVGFDISGIIFNPNYTPEVPAADNEENRNFTNSIIKTIEKFGIEKAKVAYSKKKKSESLAEYIVEMEGFNYLNNQKPEIAIQIFEMNVFAHPKSAKALQYMGEGFMETGKNEMALKYFKESLAINPENRFVNDMITKLEK